MTIKEMLDFNTDRWYRFFQGDHTECKYFYENKQIVSHNQWKDKKLHGFDKGWFFGGILSYHLIYENDKLIERIL